MDSGDPVKRPLQNVVNFRDVGKTINAFTEQKLLKEGVLFRSARPDDATKSDRDALLHEYELKTIIDLRTKSEHIKQAKKREREAKLRPEVLVKDEEYAGELQIEGVEHRKVNVNGKGFERTLLWRLSWWNIVKLLFLMLIGRRTSAIRIIATHVLLPRGLIGLGYDTLDYCQPELCTLLTSLSQPPTYPTLIHCTQGKDRTGITIVLLLLLLDVPVEAVTHDYTMSQEELMPMRETMLREIKEVGLSEGFADCPEEWVGRMKEYLDGKYGGVRSYLERIGVGKEAQMGIVEILQG